MAFADDIEISITQPLYKNGDVINVSGSIDDDSITTVIISIQSFTDDTLFNESVNVLDDGSFDFDIVLENYDLDRSGRYHIYVSYGQEIIEEEFFFDKEQNINPGYSNSELTLSESDLILTFIVAIIVISGIFAYIARHLILRRKDEYDLHEFASQKNRDYEKYHSDWMSDDDPFVFSERPHIDDEEFRKSLQESDLPNYYEILDIPKSATQNQIKKQYRLLAKKWHPDKTTESNAEETMAKINRAYDVLSDLKRRAMYDRKMGFKRST